MVETTKAESHANETRDLNSDLDCETALQRIIESYMFFTWR
jgi:hypothetical protein